MREKLTALDRIAVALTGFETALLLAFPWLWGQRFHTMFAAFGAVLPGLTRLVLTGWFPLMLGALTATGPVLGSIPAVPLAVRRWILTGAFVFGMAALALCLWGVYLPLLELAGEIKE